MRGDADKMQHCPLHRLVIYTIPIFKKGFKGDLEESDLLGPVKRDQSNIVGDTIEATWFAELELSRQRNRKPNLLKVVFRAFYWDFLILGAFQMFCDMVLSTQVSGSVSLSVTWYSGELVCEHGTQVSLSVAWYSGELVCEVSQSVTWYSGELVSDMVLNYFKPGSGVTKQEAYISSAVLALIVGLTAIMYNHIVLRSFNLGMRIRVALSSLIYRKRYTTKLRNMDISERVLTSDVGVLLADWAAGGNLPVM
uniref:ABC transmembrane type-1 domain-containing protein n=1 Tax=Timema cristinae TaxID=61476 RepID=A0A7R9CYN6_TIMCR|nr:unnamed protein product [Timema cristinae]